MASCVGFSCLFALREAAGAAVELFFPLSCQAAFPADCGFCVGSGNPVYTRTEFSRSLLAAWPK